jgi:glycerophosphoryl diester phosphodiesterase
MFKLLASDNGFVHACGHRGHSIGAPENTLAALTATMENGGTTAEIDCLLTSDGEIVLMHDHFLDRTTNGSGLVAQTSLSAIRALDAGSWFSADFAGERVPTLQEAIGHAKTIGLGLVVEIKEFLDLPRLTERLAELLEEPGANDVAIFICFDHVVLRRLKERFPNIRTEGIVHAHHADIVRVAQSAALDSVAIDHDMFRAEDGKALHDVGVAVRVHLERPDKYQRYAQAGVDLLADVRDAVAGGLIDTISGDDVRFLAELLGNPAKQQGRPAAAATEAAA